MIRHSSPLCLLVLTIGATLGGCHEGARSCSSGQESCPCEPAARCDEGLVCDPDHVCRTPNTVGLPPIDPAARSCELLLDDDSATVAGARFDPFVQGELVREAPRTAVAFFASEDRAIATDAVLIEVLGEGSFGIARAQCFDKDGRPIEGGGLGEEKSR